MASGIATLLQDTTISDSKMKRAKTGFTYYVKNRESFYVLPHLSGLIFRDNDYGHISQG